MELQNGHSIAGHPSTNGTADQASLASKAYDALRLATNWTFSRAQPDGHWVGEVRANITFTAEWIFTRQSLGLDLTNDREAYCKYIWSMQNPDGSWGLAPGFRGDVSTTTEAYLALKILNVSPKIPAMRRAQDYMLGAGGVAKVRVFTKLHLATFGLFPWDAIPQLPTELMLFSPNFPINIYTLSSWARLTSIPNLIIVHHRPIFALPNGKSANNDFLDELWCDPNSKMVPYGESLWNLWRTDPIEFGFTLMDNVLYRLGGLRRAPFLRRWARRRAVDWMLEREEGAGVWGNLAPAMQSSMVALVLEGFSLDDPPIQRGIKTMEAFGFEDHVNGKRIQSTLSPVWDTGLMALALSDACVSPDDVHLTRSLQWLKDQQLLDPGNGDWQLYKPGLVPGGYCFQYNNRYYPDIEDTGVAIMAFVRHDPQCVLARCVADATEWLLGMQNRDGGWGGFDSNNDYLFLNKIPFGDTDCLCDPSSSDVTGRIVDALGLLIHNEYVKADLRIRLTLAAQRAIRYLATEQESMGAWNGRWGCNYLYGTSNVLCGLSHFAKNDYRVQEMARRGTEWIKSVQDVSGGWGEGYESYDDPELAGVGGEVTPAQTAWALMGLLPFLSPTDDAIQRGIAHLVRSQTVKEKQAATWPDHQFTGTGFPRRLYMCYEYYAHYFPLIALGRYAQKMGMKRLEL
ncbi:hypothetical protein MMC07_003784 [Pseudocyphellaria aurata]|nr:hypothetical protein [Pseudocyphellaria aurata]